MQKIHKEIIVKGRVQGVYFRASAKEAADRLGIQGEVRNLPDGSVWIAAQGGEEAMEAFIAWCRQGPPTGKVTEVQVTLAPPHDYRGFAITR